MKGLAYKALLMNIFLKLCELNFKKMLAFRASFYISLVLMGMWVAAYAILIEVIFYYTKTLSGWTKGEVIIILAFYYLIQNIADIFFKDNIEHFGQAVRRGELDFRVTKPVSLRLLSFFWEIRFDQLAGLVITALLFWYGLANLSYVPTIVHTLAGIGVVCVSVVFYYSLLTIIASLTFWIEKTDTFNILIFNLSQLSRYPRAMYTDIFGKFLTFVVPMGLIASVPAEIALRSVDYTSLLVLLGLTAIFYLISRIVWYYGIRRYTSAN